MNRLRALACCAGACLALAACAPEASRDAWPEGAVIVGRRAALETLLDQARQLEGTPLDRRAAAVAAKLGPCEDVEGHDPGGSLVRAAESLTCADPEGPLAGVHALRDERDLAFTLSLDQGEPLRGTATVSPTGDVDLEVSLPSDAFSDARRLLLPGSRPAGPGVLSSSERLVHVRVRPASGIDLASLVPSDGQAEQLFRLKSGIFQGLVLDGTWEAALYVPEPGRPMPRAALALGFTSRRAARVAMDGFLAEIQATWSVQQVAFSSAGASGSCLPGLRLLPDLAPCYVATESALVIGWNAASVRRALTGSADEPGDSPGVARAELAHFADADARLSSLAGGVRIDAPLRWPWQRAVADAARVGDHVQIHLHLESADHFGSAGDLESAAPLDPGNDLGSAAPLDPRNDLGSAATVDRRDDLGSSAPVDRRDDLGSSAPVDRREDA